MNVSNLIGKTIIRAEIRKHENCDDEPYLDLEFSDGTAVTVLASYGGYTGYSLDEYPCYISLKEFPYKD